MESLKVATDPRREDYGPTTGKRVDVLRADYAFAKARGVSAGMLLLVQREIAAEVSK